MAQLVHHRLLWSFTGQEDDATLGRLNSTDELSFRQQNRYEQLIVPLDLEPIAPQSSPDPVKVIVVL
jgi:hypothetical protein